MPRLLDLRNATVSVGRRSLDRESQKPRLRDRVERLLPFVKRQLSTRAASVSRTESRSSRVVLHVRPLDLPRVQVGVEVFRVDPLGELGHMTGNVEVKRRHDDQWINGSHSCDVHEHPVTGPVARFHPATDAKPPTRVSIRGELSPTPASQLHERTLSPLPGQQVGPALSRRERPFPTVDRAAAMAADDRWRCQNGAWPPASQVSSSWR